VTKAWTTFKNEFNSGEQGFTLNWLPEDILQHELFQQAKKKYFHRIEIDISTIQIEAKDTIDEPTEQQELRGRLNDLIYNEYKLKRIIKDMNVKSTVSEAKLVNILKKFPPDINCLLVKNPFSFDHEEFKESILSFSVIKTFSNKVL
jgi:hypothetical protein